MEFQVQELPPEQVKKDLKRINIQIMREQTIFMPTCGTLEYTVCASNKDEIIGICTIHNDRGDHLISLYVDPNSQGQGIGSAILNKTLTIAKHNNLDLISASVSIGSVTEGMLKRRDFDMKYSFDFCRSYEKDLTQLLED